ncbi:CHKA kinase, partial [Rhodinocichla rosea]|nr:CHKA kinase [Rhodinocichla rosea]
LRDPRVSAEIAVTMARFHPPAMPFNKEPKWLFGTMEGPPQQISELTFSEPAQLQQLAPPRGYNLEQEMRSLRDLLEATPSPVAPPHNDVQEGECHGVALSISSGITCPRSQGSRGRDRGPFGVPLGSLGCPFGVPAPLPAPAPPPQLHFIRHYLSALSGGPGRAPREEQARLEEEMLREIERFTLASHFFWGLWSVVQAKISTIHFGYL